MTGARQEELKSMHVKVIQHAEERSDCFGHGVASQ